jgi:hypothetical protein
MDAGGLGRPATVSETNFLRSAMAGHCRYQLSGRHASSARSPDLLVVHAHAGRNISEKISVLEREAEASKSVYNGDDSAIYKC